MNDLAESGLRPNAELFCQYYAETRNATQSYKKAYKKNRPTLKSCAVLGHKLLRNIKIHKYIESLMGEMTLDAHIKPILLLNEYADLAFANLADMCDDGYNLKKLSKLTAGQKKAIRKLKVTTTKRYNKEGETVGEVSVVEVELFDRLKALDALAQYTGILKPEVMQQIFMQVNETKNIVAMNPDDLPVDYLEKLVAAQAAKTIEANNEVKEDE